LLLMFCGDVQGWLELNRAVRKDEYYIEQVVCSLSLLCKMLL